VGENPPGRQSDRDRERKNLLRFWLLKLKVNKRTSGKRPKKKEGQDERNEKLKREERARRQAPSRTKKERKEGILFATSKKQKPAYEEKKTSCFRYIERLTQQESNVSFCLCCVCVCETRCVRLYVVSVYACIFFLFFISCSWAFCCYSLDIFCSLY